MKDEFDAIIDKDNNIVDEYFYNSITKQFEKCYDTCKTCSIGGSLEQMNCRTCKDDYVAVVSGGITYCLTCPETTGQFSYDPSTSKIKCVYESRHNCSTSLPIYFPETKQCDNECPTDYFLHRATKECYQDCSNGNYKFMEDTCVENCPDNEEIYLQLIIVNVYVHMVTL